MAAVFDAPEERWGPGHRGLDLRTTTGARVAAVSDGVVTHRGRIAGRGTVSITHASGVRSTYEPVDSTLVVGQRVHRGDPIGRIADLPGHCPPSSCLHLGAKRGSGYLDPLPFFGGPRRVILVDEIGFAPLDDTGAQLLFRFVAAAYERRSLGVASHHSGLGTVPARAHHRRIHARPAAAPRHHRGHQRQSYRMRQARQRRGGELPTR